MQFCLFSSLGAYEPFTHVYKPTDVADIIMAAADRGIRVIPEFDMPGSFHPHTIAKMIGVKLMIKVKHMKMFHLVHKFCHMSSKTTFTSKKLIDNYYIDNSSLTKSQATPSRGARASLQS